MSITKHTSLAAIEFLPQQRAIHVAHHTVILEGDVVISGPTIHRQAFAEADDKEAILTEISSFVSEDYIKAVGELNLLKQELSAAYTALAAKDVEIQTLMASAGTPEPV